MNGSSLEPRTWVSRRHFMAGTGAASLAALLGGAEPASALSGEQAAAFGALQSDITTRFPQKGAMILRRTRPPLLETPFEVFDRGVFTPNDRFYVRWHLPGIPTTIDPTAFQLKVRGQVRQPLSLTLDELVRTFPSFEIAAVNQCSGNSRRLFDPQVNGAQWANGAMGNALWRGVRLRDVLDRAGVAPNAVQVRFRGLDTGLLPQTPDYMKSLDIDHARDGEVMIAYAMNGEALPLLNGFPLRLVVPGWYATYWVKMLSDIEVLSTADDNYWTSKAYLVPDTPRANITPDQKDVKLIPISRMVPRSFFTGLESGAVLKRARQLSLRGIAFGGDAGVAAVLVSLDSGNHWQSAQLRQDHGKYSFRRWELPVRFDTAGPRTLMVKSVNSAGLEQPEKPNWNTGGYMRNPIESLSVQVI